MIKKLTCIECPVGCALSVDIETCRVVKVSGNKCPRGEKYAVCETENPVRFLTSVVLAQGLDLKMVPVRTDKPVPRGKLKEAMVEIKKMRITEGVRAGEVVAANFMGLGVNLVATREAADKRIG